MNTSKIRSGYTFASADVMNWACLDMQSETDSVVKDLVDGYERNMAKI